MKSNSDYINRVSSFKEKIKHDKDIEDFIQMAERMSAKQSPQIQNNNSATQLPSNSSQSHEQNLIISVNNHAQINQLWENAQIYQNNKKFNIAVLMYKKILDIDPNHFEAFNKLSVLKDRFDKADLIVSKIEEDIKYGSVIRLTKLFAEVSNLYPDHPKFLYLSSELLNRIERKDEFFRRAQYFAQRGDSYNAHNCLVSVLNIDPEDEGIKFAIKQLERSIETYEKIQYLKEI